MSLLLAFIAGAVCATLLILIVRRGAATQSLPQLDELRSALQQIRVDQRGESGELRGVGMGMVDQQERLVRQTGQLSEALRRPGIRGQWGESTSNRAEIRALGPGACSVTRATAPGRLLAGTGQAIGKRLRGRAVGAGVVPEFVPKHPPAMTGADSSCGANAIVRPGSR
jgi:hypothetical protein